jgi:hypothetical protein
MVSQSTRINEMKWNVYGFVQNPHGVADCRCGGCLSSDNPRYIDRLVDADSAEQAVDKVNGLLHIKAEWLNGCPHVELFSTDTIRAEEESVLVIG